MQQLEAMYLVSLLRNFGGAQANDIGQLLFNRK
jgi:hypothetical protein